MVHLSFYRSIPTKIHVEKKKSPLNNLPNQTHSNCNENITRLPTHSRSRWPTTRRNAPLPIPLPPKLTTPSRHPRRARRIRRHKRTQYPRCTMAELKREATRAVTVKAANRQGFNKVKKLLQLYQIYFRRWGLFEILPDSLSVERAYFHV